MRKKLAFYSLLFTALLLSACSYPLAPAQSVAVVPATHLTKNNALPQFSSLKILGNADINIQLINEPNNRFIGEGDDELICAVSYVVIGDCLVIDASAIPPGAPVKLNFYLYQPKSVTYQGNGNINIIGLRQDSFVLQVGGLDHVSVSGKVQRFDAFLSGASVLDARCLCAKMSFVHAAQVSEAHLMRGAISAFATEHANIYYYGTPTMVVDFEGQNGSVMRMHGINTYMPACAMSLTSEAVIASRGRVPARRILEGRG